MSDTQKVLELAKSYVGYLEKASNSQLESKTANAGSANYTIFAKKYADYGFGNYQGQAWCAMAVTVLFYDALGADKAKKIIKPYSYCPYGVNDWKSKGRWHSRTSGYIPKPGDVVFFYSGNESTHTGIVYACDGSTVYTYEGNTSDGSTLIPNGGAFCKKSYSISYSRILGYGNPDWESIEEDEEMTSEERAKFNYLVEEVSKLRSAVDKLSKPMIYNYIDNNMPEWARDGVKYCVDNGIIQGTGDGLGLDDKDLKYCTIIKRLMTKWG